MKKRLLTFLSSLRGDVFKLLPMKESEIDGAENHINEYLDSLIINIRGALGAYPELEEEGKLIYVLNNLQYIRNNGDVKFKQWRKIILDATKDIDNLCICYGGKQNADTKQL